MTAQIGMATVPEAVLIGKLGFHQQISATTLTPSVSGFALDVYMASAVPASTVVRLRKPSGQLISLEQDSPDQFSHFEYFPNEADLAAAYPQGTYAIIVTDGGAETTTSLSFSSNVASPSRITNYDALQTASANPQVTWVTIPAQGTSESLSLHLVSAGGISVNELDLPTAGATSASFSDLLLGESYHGQLLYLSFVQSAANDGTTAIFAISGFGVSFPVIRGSAVQSAPESPRTVGAFASALNEITLSWQPPGGANPATGYKLERASDASFQSDLVTLALNSAASSYIDRSVSANTQYYYRLSATNSAGTSAPSTTMQAQTPASEKVGATSFVNIATRAYCATGNNVTIGGFVISGSASKRVLVRAVGPSLTGQGLAAGEVLLDPVIEVHQGLPVIASNNNWNENADAAEIASVGARIGAAPLLATDTKSSALLLTLSPGVYSFVVNGNAGTSGIVLLEVYDADATESVAEFVNIATRAYSTPGNGVTIGGFVVSGSAAKQVLIRAVGPTLMTQGLAGSEVLANPVIELYRGAPVIATNDNWIANENAIALEETAARIGAVPFASNDAASAALLLKLPPGVYSFIARGKADTAGIVLVEVYDAD